MATSWTVTPGSAQAATAERLLQLNICGNVCYEGADQAGQDISNSVAGSLPVVVTLNEVCGNQLTAARLALAARGYQYDEVFGQTIATGASALRPACRGYGNGLLVRRTGSTGNAGSVSRDLLPDFGEDRLILCARVIDAAYTACVTHLSAGSDTTGENNRRAQMARVVDVLRSKSALGPVTFSGDLNTKPTSSVLDPLYDATFTGPGGTSRRLQEADACGTRSEQTSDCNEGTLDTFGTDPKLDYVFVTRGPWTVSSADATTSVTSDHDPLFANVVRTF